MPQDFTKKKPTPVRPPLRVPEEASKPASEYSARFQQYVKDLNLDGKVLDKEGQQQEMVGIDQNLLRQKMEENERRKEELLRSIAATWRCTVCKREWPGKYVRVRVLGGLWQMVNGVRTLVGGKEVPVCVDRLCDSPVVRSRTTTNGS